MRFDEPLPGDMFVFLTNNERKFALMISITRPEDDCGTLYVTFLRFGVEIKRRTYHQSANVGVFWQVWRAGEVRGHKGVR